MHLSKMQYAFHLFAKCIFCPTETLAEDIYEVKCTTITSLNLSKFIMKQKLSNCAALTFPIYFSRSNIVFVQNTKSILKIYYFNRNFPHCAALTFPMYLSSLEIIFVQNEKSIFEIYYETETFQIVQHSLSQ